ncbi:NHL repeat-containing protein [Mucilaginibacter sp.]|uniref:NHL repeat-containing protein n=1 Tax=Mucilaginibacter sp. TaxID=1882438 RepID=UPI003D0EDCC4
MKRYKFNNTIAIASIVLLPALIFTACKKDSPAKSGPTAISTTGVLSVFAGSGVAGSANGAASVATFNYPQGIASDAAGNFYVADQGNNEIRKISPAGAVTTLAGTLVAGSTNATAIGVSALFNAPAGVAVDATNNVYVADYGNNAIRKITVATGAVTTLAGGKSGAANGTGTAATFNGPSGVAVDATGNVYVADFLNNQIRKITPAGVVTTLAGSTTAGAVNGTGAAASFNGPRGVAVDASGNVYVADAGNNLIREISPAGVVTTFAGTGAAGNVSGAANASTFYYPSGLTVNANGDVYVADAVNNLVRKISGGTVTSIAGSGYATLSSALNGPTGVALDPAGNIYVANDLGQTIKKIVAQ